MAVQQGPFKAILITKGRTTGKSHSVTLRGVMYNGKVYFSRHRPDSDWFKNASSNNRVDVVFEDSRHLGIAKVVTDETLNQKISQIKYPGEERANEKRVAIEVTLYEQP